MSLNYPYDKLRRQYPLHDPSLEKDSCGTGFVANISGKRSHAIVQNGVRAVINLTHRGAVSADAKTGDGAGILTQIPHKLFAREVGRLGKKLKRDEDLGVGMIFFPKTGFYGEREKARVIIEEAVTRNGLNVLGWRNVPVDDSVLGEQALQTQPEIEQILIERGKSVRPEDYERTLYLVRRQIENRIEKERIDDFYIPSFSSRTIVYKGLLVAPQLDHFYQDLSDPLFESAIAVFHQRYSTNTFPNWFLAQPFRILGHNGEINTLQGNKNWTRAREADLKSPLWKTKIEALKPVIQAGGSDSAALDNAMEFLSLSGRDLLHAILMMIPEAWENLSLLDPKTKAFYEYHAGFVEPWDGPAALAFSDGRIVGASLDRNGLRPARYVVTKDGMVLMGSEVGMLELDEMNVAEKGRLGPGMMIAIDTQEGKFYHNAEIKKIYSERKPYGDWLRKNRVSFEDIASASIAGGAEVETSDLLRQQMAFGYTLEDLAMILAAMGKEGKEPVGSMGDDTPLSVLSQKPRTLYTYFRQLFAQVTNPPIDHLRENLVFSLTTYLGPQHNILDETPEHARLLKLKSHILTEHELHALKRLKDDPYVPTVLDAVFEPPDSAEDEAAGAALENGLLTLCRNAEKAVRGGKTVLILSDRKIDRQSAPIPMLLAVGAVQTHLINQGLRMRASLIAESAEARDVHHIATLIGYGASAVCPYLAFETVRDLAAQGKVAGQTPETAVKNYIKALLDGQMKIMSKMGIASITSYRGAQIFEAVGINRSLADRFFSGTSCRIGGVGLPEIARDVLAGHRRAFCPEAEQKMELVEAGAYRYRSVGEFHAFNPEVVKTLHTYVKSGRLEDYVRFSDAVNKREQPVSLRDLLRFKKTEPTAIEKVEPIGEICKRFRMSGVSHGALSREAHETLAVAMNRMAAKSSSGEGGEDPERYKPRPNGDSARSEIKQIASGRFGVTTEYATQCVEFEIKMAQGSKPGEGGQLPGHKVSEEIARIRHSVPGVTLISPPPHHDIYSIEDLAQLIYDLKRVNKGVKVCVKLVSESGVGTVAAGCVKAHADIVLISGHDGGTGASPLSSIKYAGSPWEIGLAEAQQVLVLNNLRGKVRLRADGGLKTGRDVVIAAMLGAEEYGFGTAAAVAVGCVMVRQCHLNTCPVGVATQDLKLRAKYAGTPEGAVRYFEGIAHEVRWILADLGLKSLDEAVGRIDLLEVLYPEGNQKARLVDFSDILAQVDPHGSKPKRCQVERNDWEGDEPLDDEVCQKALSYVDRKESASLSFKIRNIDRTVGARLSGEIARRYALKGLPGQTIECRFTGSAGQSFGAFLVNGLRFILEGEANDYVGKGLSGGELIIHPKKGVSFNAWENSVIGNTVMYGATAGVLYAAGRAGERFCVRNSGGQAVVEGIGDHGCEYMTGGRVVVLGTTGNNFGAGMTGGTAFVLDEDGLFEQRLNKELVRLEPLRDGEDAAAVKSMIEKHVSFTESVHGRKILSDWTNSMKRFAKVVPK